jgi:chromosome segregation ATPase
VANAEATSTVGGLKEKLQANAVNLFKKSAMIRQMRDAGKEAKDHRDVAEYEVKDQSKLIGDLQSTILGVESELVITRSTIETLTAELRASTRENKRYKDKYDEIHTDHRHLKESSIGTQERSAGHEAENAVLRE